MKLYRCRQVKNCRGYEILTFAVHPWHTVEVKKGIVLGEWVHFQLNWKISEKVILKRGMVSDQGTTLV